MFFSMLFPYQVLFPIGVLYGVYGALVWVLYLFGLIPYPGGLHAHLMVVGFLFSFALGFLMTAVPRFTGTDSARSWELAVAVILALSSFLGVYPEGIALAVLAFLFFFSGSRFLRRAYAPPMHFIFVPLGLLLGLAGVVLMWIGAAQGRVFLYQGTMLCFVLGVGGKLVSMLLGWGAQPLLKISVVGQSARKERLPLNVWGPAALLLLGFLLEFSVAFTVGRILRALAASWVAFAAWHLHRRPLAEGRLVRWLWVAAWGLVLGLWFSAVVPSAGVHGLHLTFISGFGLMTLMIASRVTLAHGGHDLEFELHSKTFAWAGGMLLLAALMRATAPLASSYFSHLAYAAGVWMVGLVGWSLVFVPRAFFHAASRYWRNG